jgi:ABC-type phosphate/phosphonate transport system substrate-binding protein/rhodanese-related sulfurtransferase
MIGRWLRWFWLLAFLALPARAADLVLNVTLDYDQEHNHVAARAVFNELAALLGAAAQTRVRLVLTQNAERVGEHIRTQSYDLLLAPAQLIGLSMRHGYLPVARSEQSERIVLLARAGSGLQAFDQTQGKVLVLPHRESLVSYMVRGEMNALGLSLASHFGRVVYVNGYEAALYSMGIGQADVVAVKASNAADWLKANPGARIIKTFTDVPLVGLAASGKLTPAVRDRLRTAMTKLDKGLELRLAAIGVGAMDPADAVDFEYVSTRGFFTPEILSGASIVNAKQVAELMAKGVPLFDVRPAAHYREGHIPKSVNVTYAMNSVKETDYDDSVDKFDLSKLPKDKNAPMIFQCNGAECWYSYKAARYMVKRGFKRIYWFRTGLPDWKASGYATEK